MKALPLLKRPYFCRRILEVGGGHAPYAGVTHAVDKFPTDNAQRAGSLQLPKGVEFREGDLESIPFGPFASEDEKFDFIYVSHVLEHVADPVQAVREVNRVSRKGYIETPSPLREQLACPLPFDPQLDFHLLYLWSSPSANTFHFIRKSARTAGQFCDCAKGRAARRLFELHRQEKRDLEPLLPRPAKTSSIFFQSPLLLIEYVDFSAACAAGHCAYRHSILEAHRWISLPWCLTSLSRFGKLRALMPPIT